jgi:LysM repeat protein
MSRFHVAMTAAVFGLGVAATGATAHASGKVAVLNVEGDQSGQVEDALTSIVEDEHEVVSSQTFDEVAEKAGVKSLDTKGIAKVAKRLEVAAVIEGVMTRQEDGYQLLVRVRAQSGKTTKKLAVLMPGKKLTAKDKKSLGVKVLAALDEIDPRSGRARKDENLDGESKDAKHRARTGKLKNDDDDDSGAADDADDAPAPKAKAKAKKAKKHAKPEPASDDDDSASVSDDDGGDQLAMRDRKRAEKKAKHKANLEVDSNDDVATDAPAAQADDDAAPAPKAKKAKRHAKADDGETEEAKMLEGDDVAMADDEDGASASASSRSDDDDDAGVHAHATRTHDAGLEAAVVDAGIAVIGRKLTFSSRAYDQAPRGYQGPFVPAGEVEGVIYPLALSDRSGAAAGLGFDFEYDQVTSLTTKSSQALDVALPTSEKHFNIGGRYRIPLGHGARAASVAIGFDYSHREFVVNRAALPAAAVLDLPDVVYKAYAPELALRIPLGPRVTLTAEGRALLIKSAGAIQSKDEYGAAKVTGGEGNAGLEVLVAKNVILRVAGTATFIGYKFTGNGQQSINRDGDATTVDVGGAMDQYIGGSATLGILY